MRGLSAKTNEAARLEQVSPLSLMSHSFPPDFPFIRSRAKASAQFKSLVKSKKGGKAGGRKGRR